MPETEAFEVQHFEDVDMTPQGQQQHQQQEEPSSLIDGRSGHPEVAGRHGSGPGSFITLLLGLSLSEDFKPGTLGGPWPPSAAWDYTLTNATYAAPPVIPKPNADNEAPVGHPCAKPTPDEMAHIRPHPHAFYTKQYGWHVATPWSPTTSESSSTIKLSKNHISPCPAFVDQCASSAEMADKGLGHHFTLDRNAVDPKFLLKQDATGSFGSVEACLEHPKEQNQATTTSSSNATGDDQSQTSGAVASTAASPMKTSAPQSEWLNLLYCSMPEDTLALALTTKAQAIPGVLHPDTIQRFEQAKMENPGLDTSPEATVACAWDAVWRWVSQVLRFFDLFARAD